MSKPDDDFYVLSIRFAEEPQWDEWVSVVGTRETVSQQFDLDNLPPGAVLRKGAEARRWLASAGKAEEKVARFLRAKLNPILTRVFVMVRKTLPVPVRIAQRSSREFRARASALRYTH